MQNFAKDMTAAEAKVFMAEELAAIHNISDVAERLKQAHEFLTRKGLKPANRRTAEEMLFHELDIRLTEFEIERCGHRTVH